MTVYAAGAGASALVFEFCLLNSDLVLAESFKVQWTDERLRRPEEHFLSEPRHLLG